MAVAAALAAVPAREIALAVVVASAGDSEDTRQTGPLVQLDIRCVRCNVRKPSSDIQFSTWLRENANVDAIMTGSSAIRQSKTILARF